MKNNILRRFQLHNEKETPELVHDAIAKAVPFEGTNLWILIFAIVIASLGLNVNSTAVVIGAMLISPLMGPIIGIGYSLSINDLPLLKKSLTNYAFAGLVGLAASTVYFLLTPIHDASSEILARTEPSLYDVLIAFFGGLAGILAACSKQKGNVIPGVAIATALMPPLCTAGYGLATMNFTYLFGALYLYIINSVFISVASYVTVRYLNLPYRQFPDASEQKKSKRIITAVTLITLIPSVYFAFDIVQRNRFNSSAKEFINNETTLRDNVILRTNIDPKEKVIELSYIGKDITDSTKNEMRKRLSIYKIPHAELKINQGLSYLNQNEKKGGLDESDKFVQIEKVQLQNLQLQIDSIKGEQKLSRSIYTELKTLYPSLRMAFVEKGQKFTDSITKPNQHVAHLRFDKKQTPKEMAQIKNFLALRLNDSLVDVYILP